MGLMLILLIASPLAVMGLLFWSCLIMAGSADRRGEQCREEWLREKRGGPVNLRFTIYDLRAETEISNCSHSPAVS